MSIPKILHFIWIGRPMPEWVSANIGRWRELNPGYDVRLHGESALLPEWQSLYSRCADLCTRSDLLRLSVLREHGGWYFDMDFIPLRPMDDIYADYDLSCGCFLTKQWEPGPKRIANGVIGLATDAPVWTEILQIIAESQFEPLERTTFGPLLATRVVQRCPETVVSEISEFYLWRFGTADARGITESMRKYETLLHNNFAPSAIEATCGGKRPYAVHLWMGGKYDWSPSKPMPDLPPATPAPSDSAFCGKCGGKGCAECHMSGFRLQQQSATLPPRDKAEPWFDAYGWKVSCWEAAKIVLLPK